MIGFETEGFEAVVEALDHDIKLLANLLDDSNFLDLLTGLVANNFDRVWRSEGASIGEDWNGRTLVKTGRLRASLTTPGAIDLQVVGDFAVFSSRVSYDRYVDGRYRFYGVDPIFDSALGDLVNGFLKQYGRLQWQ